MWSIPSEEQLAKIPALYKTEHIPLKDKIIHMHFFIGGCDWFICEFDGIDTFFGFAILNQDLEMAEWGYMSLTEFKSIKIGGWLEVDNDLYWKPKPASEVPVICQAQGWHSNTKKNSTGGSMPWHTLQN